MPALTYYVIKHKPTGTLMPARMSRRSRGGWTHWEPLIPHQEAPRMFPTLRAARNALTCWLEGAWEMTYTGGSYYETPEPYAVVPQLRAGRRREDMEIFEVQLVAT